MTDNNQTGSATSTLERAEMSPPKRRLPHPETLARVALGALICLPVVLALAEALRSPRLNFNDFWLVLGLTTTPDGTFRPAETLTLYNGHPIEVVSLVFWLDAKFFAGANWTLGVLSVLLSGAILAAMWSMLPARLTGVRRLAVVAALAALVFSSAAMIYFGIGMLGVQFLLGLAPSVVAIAFAHRGRMGVAVLFGILASLGHGTGLPVWFALGAVAWLRRDRPWRVLLPLAIGLVVLVLWRVVPQTVVYPKPILIGADTLLATMLASVGKVWSATSLDLAMLAGAVTVALFVVLAVPAIRERLRPGQAGPDAPPRPDAGWFGVATQMIIAAAMIGISRGGYGTEEGLAHRYVGIGLLLACALVVLVVTRGPRIVRAHVVPVALTVALASYAIGSTTAAEARRQYPSTPTLAVAMRTEANAVISKHYGYPEFQPVLRSMGVYPFTDDFTLGCGGVELGHSVDLGRVVDLEAPGAGRKTTGYLDTPTGVVGDTELSGWAMIDGQQAECVLVVDGSGTVVGGGSVGLPRKDVLPVAWGTGRSGWQAVARPGIENGSVLVRHNGTLYRVTAGNQPAPR